MVRYTVHGIMPTAVYGTPHYMAQYMVHSIWYDLGTRHHTDSRRYMTLHDIIVHGRVHGMVQSTVYGTVQRVPPLRYDTVRYTVPFLAVHDAWQSMVHDRVHGTVCYGIRYHTDSTRYITLHGTQSTVHHMIGYTVRYIIGYTVRHMVGYTVGYTVRYRIGYTVGYSVWYTVSY